MTRKNHLLAAGIAVAICAVAAFALYQYTKSPLQVVDETLASLAGDYGKVQAVVYTGMVDLDSASGPIEINGKPGFFRVIDPEVQTMADFEELLARVYTQPKADEILTYCTETTGILTEKDGHLYRADAFETGWPLEQKASAAQREGDTITAEVTLAYNKPTPGTLTLQKEAGMWKISDISM